MTLEVDLLNGISEAYDYSNHIGDVRAQTRRTLLNIAGLLFTRAAGVPDRSGLLGLCAP